MRAKFQVTTIEQYMGELSLRELIRLIDTAAAKELGLRHLDNLSDIKIEEFDDGKWLTQEVEYHTSHSWYDTEKLKKLEAGDEELFNALMLVHSILKKHYTEN